MRHADLAGDEAAHAQHLVLDLAHLAIERLAAGVVAGPVACASRLGDDRLARLIAVGLLDGSVPVVSRSMLCHRSCRAS